MSKSGRNLNGLLKDSGAGDAQTLNSSKVPSASEFKSVGLSLSKAPRGISFGHLPSQKSTTKSSTSIGSKLLQKTVASGLKGIVSSFLGPLGGSLVGSLISSFSSLFGGAHKTEAPLQAFTLPQPMEANVTTGTAISVHGNGQASYGSMPDAASGQWINEHNREIADAVKAALLQSHSLSDVIGDL